LLVLVVFLTGCSSSHSARVAKQAPLAAHTQSDPTTSSEVALGARLRRTYEADLEAAILSDARLLVRSHFLRGPILGVSCTPMERGGHPIVNSTIHFNCIAINRWIEGTAEGARYFGTIDLATGSRTYHGH
jgi:hypothetical protein